MKTFKTNFLVTEIHNISSELSKISTNHIKKIIKMCCKSQLIYLLHTNID